MTTDLLETPFNQYEALLDFLDRLDVSVMKLGTERVERVLAHLGHPQNRIKTIHVAGTNGKGSTCSLLASIYTHAGYQTGLFVSPHLVDIRERIQHQNRPIDENAFLDAARSVYTAMTTVFPDRNDWLTYFEYLTVMAFYHFAADQVDVAIIETGLGGRLDATNVIKSPLASIITRIAMDHVDRLGPTLADIAFEKAGIIKPNVPVYTLPQPETVTSVFKRQAQSQLALLRFADPDRIRPGPLSTFQNKPFREITDVSANRNYLTSYLGRYQQDNIALVLAIIDGLQEHLPVSESALKAGLQNTAWPGRFQWFPEQCLIIDGSHNEHGFQALLETVKQDFPETKIHWGLSLLKNRPLSLIDELLAYSNTKRISFLAPESPKTFHEMPAFREKLRSYPDISDVAYGVSFAEFCKHPVEENSLKLITGSLYTAGAVLQNLSFL